MNRTKPIISKKGSTHYEPAEGCLAEWYIFTSIGALNMSCIVETCLSSNFEIALIPWSVQSVQYKLSSKLSNENGWSIPKLKRVFQVFTK